MAVLTGHSCVDYELVVRAAKAVLDTRNVIGYADDAFQKAWML